MFNLRKLDLNLLNVFEAVYEAGSMQGAGDRLGLSQSGTSHALPRLREQVRSGRELFVRSGHRLAPTPQAAAAYLAIKQGLESVRAGCAELVAFNPPSRGDAFRSPCRTRWVPSTGSRCAMRLQSKRPGSN